MTRKPQQASLPAYFIAVQIIGALAVATGAADLFSNLRPMIIGIAPWLGMSWIAWGFLVLGILIVLANGARFTIHVQRIKQRAAS